MCGRISRMPRFALGFMLLPDFQAFPNFQTSHFLQNSLELSNALFFSHSRMFPKYWVTRTPHFSNFPFFQNVLDVTEFLGTPDFLRMCDSFNESWLFIQTCCMVDAITCLLHRRAGPRAVLAHIWALSPYLGPWLIFPLVVS